MQVKVMFARFPYGRSEDPRVADWLIPTVTKAKADPRISDVFHVTVDDTPITMSRNRACLQAKRMGADLLCMIDADMQPDLPGEKPFWDTSLDFMLQHEGPCVVGAPYCGPPPYEAVYVFRWAAAQSGHPNADMRLEMFGREDAAARIGFEEVGALPTGLILIDMRALEYLTPPWFDYEYKDSFQAEKATTEDVFFTRNLSLAGVPQYVNWDSWAGHIKRKVVGKPSPLTADAVREQFKDAIRSGRHSRERLVNVNEGVPGHIIEQEARRLAAANNGGGK